MRVSTDPTDPAYIDARPRKAWCNDIEIDGWTVADEFRRVVITPTKVHNGSVRVERLPDLTKPEPVEAVQTGYLVVKEDRTPTPVESVTITNQPPIETLPKVKQEHWKQGKRR